MSVQWAMCPNIGFISFLKRGYGYTEWVLDFGGVGKIYLLVTLIILSTYISNFQRPSE